DAARAPWLYLEGGVPDTVEGRLEALTIHALLLMRRLKALPDRRRRWRRSSSMSCSNISTMACANWASATPRSPSA
ncbi:MAG: hypothetical protein HC904_16655, partial [Blastochloris sp.]|nr:hypothetical protein [Blastochloris sp.]